MFEKVLQEASISYIHASGPGGQNVNKVATAVQLRFDACNSTVLDEGTRNRLLRIAGKRVTSDGIILIEAKRYRSQEKNREDAQQRLLALIQKACTPPEKRIATNLPLSSKIARREDKKRTSSKKQSRRDVSDWE